MPKREVNPSISEPNIAARAAMIDGFKDEFRSEVICLRHIKSAGLLVFWRSSEPWHQTGWLHRLVKSLGVPLYADFSHIASGNKDEICNRQSEPDRPPDGGYDESRVVGRDGVG